MSPERGKKRRSNLGKGFLYVTAHDYSTGKLIHFDINLGKVTLPHHVDIIPKDYQVVFVNKAINGDKSIGGMNFFASKAYKMKYEYPPNVVMVAKQTTDPKGLYANRRDKLLGTVAHEIIEAELMRLDPKLPYRIAHMYTMEYEKGLHKSANSIRVRVSGGDNTYHVVKEYDGRALLDALIANSRVYFGAVMNRRGEWVQDTGFVEDVDDLDEWWRTHGEETRERHAR